MKNLLWQTYHWIQGILGIWLGIVLSIHFGRDAFIGSIVGASNNLVLFPTLEYAIVIVSFFMFLGASMMLLSFRVQGYSYTMAVAVGLSSLFLFGPVVAIWIMVGAGLLRAIALFLKDEDGKYYWLLKMVSNSGSQVIQLVAASWVYIKLGGNIPLRTITYHHGLFQPHLAGWSPPFITMLVYFLTNNLLYLPGEFLGHRSVKRYFIDSLNRDGIIYLTILPLSIIMSVIYIQSGFFPFLLFSVLLVAASAAFKIMMETRIKLEKSISELKILNRVGRTMSSTMDMNRQFERMYLECRKILEFDNFFIAIFEPEKRVFELNYLREKGHLSTGEIISLGEGYTSIVWETKQPIILNHWDDKQFYNVKIPENDRFQEKATSMIFVPMIFKDEVIGVLSIQHAEPNKYTVEDMTILATLANQAAISLSNARLYHTAITEPLTQLHSRNYFFSRFDEELKKCHASKQPLHLLVMDIDEFKMMNDKQGHLVGDEILRSTARVIESNIPGQAIPARYGGDEFMVLLPGTDRDTAFHIAETLRELIHNNPIQYNSLEFSVTVSIGLAGVNGNEIVEKEKIVIDADKGLYEAKTKGKNQVVVYSV